jgi:hypothetical protein
VDLFNQMNYGGEIYKTAKNKPYTFRFGGILIPDRPDSGYQNG